MPRQISQSTVIAVFRTEVVQTPSEPDVSAKKTAPSLTRQALTGECSPLQWFLLRALQFRQVRPQHRSLHVLTMRKSGPIRPSDYSIQDDGDGFDQVHPRFGLPRLQVGDHFPRHTDFLRQSRQRQASSIPHGPDSRANAPGAVVRVLR
jgi:hypothetical protein